VSKHTWQTQQQGVRHMAFDMVMSIRILKANVQSGNDSANARDDSDSDAEVSPIALIASAVKIKAKQIRSIVSLSFFVTFVKRCPTLVHECDTASST
jgi:hypothetical protein